jgi:hypothetical protein
MSGGLPGKRQGQRFFPNAATIWRLAAYDSRKDRGRAYDEGKPGEVYHDVDEKNHGADFRGVTQVDIEKRPDASGGHGIGWIKPGEWLTYSVIVAEAGTYKVEIPVASDKKGGTLHLEFGGKDVTGPIDVPDTGGWQKLQTITKKNVRLKSGMYVMKMVMDKAGTSGYVADIDYVRFVKASP